MGRRAVQASPPPRVVVVRPGRHGHGGGMGLSISRHWHLVGTSHTLGTRFGGRLATHSSRSPPSMATPAHAPYLPFATRHRRLVWGQRRDRRDRDGPHLLVGRRRLSS